MRHTVDIAPVFAVKMVIHSDKANAKKGKHARYIVANGNVISAKPGQVFYNNALDSTTLGCLQERCYTGPVK